MTLFKKHKKKKHDSIKRQLALVFGGMMALTIFLCWFINSTFLEKYYIREKKDSLLTAYERLNEAVKNNSITSEAFSIELQKICGRYNMSMVIINAESKTIISTQNEADMMKRELLDHLFSDALSATNANNNSVEGKKNPAKIIAEEDNYVIQISLDPRTNTEYVEMWGALENGNIFLIRCALESIRESVAISNRFLFYVGIAAIIFSYMVINFISRLITKPVSELTDISKRMTNLDFEAKYTGNSNNEIGVLGEYINQLSNNLEITISELKTANNELKKDIDEKNQVDEMRKEFLSNVSHELKTPIALIQGYAEGLKEGIHEDEESKEFYCDVIMDEADRMNKMVKKLLTLNQLEFGNDNITMEHFDMAALIKNYLQSAEILTRQNEIQVHFEQEESVYVWADEFKIEEVFMNFFTNAVNHCSGEKIIDIKILSMEKKARICVFNTGEQIPEESLPYIWDKFYKVDKARTREYGGSGVGLSIVKAIMESLNQKFGVCNFDNGVEFWFELDTNSQEIVEDGCFSVL